ncbi:MAG: phosphotransferase, partial [Candidatus Bathyarchaeota archaeon]
ALKQLGDSSEFFILLEKVEGKEYYQDLERIMKQKSMIKLDVPRCRALSDYLVKIHSKKNTDPQLYRRRIRDLIGHGECIMGLIDNYPSNLDFTDQNELALIEKKCLGWRWKIREKDHRLCQVHGDYHPWNILFQKGSNFKVLDRSRGEWGEAADDLASLSMNYLFFSLQVYGKLAGPFEKLYKTFIGNYLEKTGDEELLTVIQPFCAWRALVLASPIWYPNISYNVRRKIFNFIHNVLDTKKMNVAEINSYLKKS